MGARDLILEQQILWAQRQGILLGGPYRNSDDPDERARGRKSWVFELNDNLFEPLSDDARGAFEAADGRELSVGRPGEGNMYALQSSSALACNLFHYWGHQGNMAPLAGALRLPTTGITSLSFEVKYPIDPSRPRSPNLDAVIEYREGDIRAAAVECKFTEPYGRAHGGLDPAYLAIGGLWDGLPNLRHLAVALSPNDASYRHLHAAQLLKHILGLSRAYGRQDFRLVYCWYAVPGSESERHEQEVIEFTDVAAEDGVVVQAVTYQDVIPHLASLAQDAHGSYVDYLAARYL